MWVRHYPIQRVLVLHIHRYDLDRALPEYLEAVSRHLDAILNWTQGKSLQELPPALGLCVSLVELHAGFNALTTVPGEIGLCDSLAILDVRNNRISSLGEGLPMLRLSLLDLTNNNISALPSQLGQMTTLRAMPLAGNSIKSIPISVQQGMSFLLAL